MAARVHRPPEPRHQPGQSVRVHKRVLPWRPRVGAEVVVVPTAELHERRRGGGRLSSFPSCIVGWIRIRGNGPLYKPSLFIPTSEHACSAELVLVLSNAALLQDGPTPPPTICGQVFCGTDNTRPASDRRTNVHHPACELAAMPVQPRSFRRGVPRDRS